MQLTCELRQESGTIFRLVEIKKQDNIVLYLKLVGLKSWLAWGKEAAEEIRLFQAKLGIIRADGIPAVILWEDVWESRKEIVQSRLSAIAGISQRIPARVTQVRKIDRPTAAEFLNANHLQGAAASKIRYGLFLPRRYFRVLDKDFPIKTDLEELLVAIATFSHPRVFSRDGIPFRSFELIRFSNLKNTTVVGGLDKLLRAFTKEYRPGDIMTYADLEWSEGGSYRRIGFQEISDKDPIVFFLDPATNTRYPENRRHDRAELIRIINAGSRKFVKVIV